MESLDLEILRKASRAISFRLHETGADCHRRCGAWFRAGVASDLVVFEPIAGAEYRLERHEGGAELGLRVTAASEAIVEVAHSANEWTPLRLTREGDAFVARIPLASGTHKVAVRVNRGEWRASRGLEGVSDDFGGNAGLVVVP